MRSRLASLLAGLALATVSTAQAQSPLSLALTPGVRFESWRPAVPGDRLPAAIRIGASSRDRERHALIGGAIGAAAGVAFCTVISTLANDSADGGLSFCPASSYLLIGGAGFALGFAIGWAI